MRKIFDQYGTPLEENQSVAVSRNGHIVKGTILKITENKRTYSPFVRLAVTYPLNSATHLDSCCNFRTDEEGNIYMIELLVL